MDDAIVRVTSVLRTAAEDYKYNASYYSEVEREAEHKEALRVERIFRDLVDLVESGAKDGLF